MSLQQACLELKAFNDPAEFLRNPYFLGIKPYPLQEKIFTSFYTGKPKDYDYNQWLSLPILDRTKLSTPFKELIVVAGMRSGKTTLAASMACYSAFKTLVLPDPSKRFNLIPGSDIYIILVATGEEQASDTIFGKTKTLVRQSPFFQKYNPKIYDLEIRFPNKHLYMLAGTSSSSGMVGRDVIFMGFDELSKFEDSEGKRGAELVYTSLTKSTMTFGFEGKIVSITSPLFENDIGMRVLEKSTRLPSMLGYHLATWEMNPNLAEDSPEMIAERDKDPITFMRDFGAVPYSSYDRFYADDSILTVDTSMPNILDLVHKNIDFIPPEENRYFLTGDPALKHDSFGIALGHNDHGILEVDGLFRFTPTKRDINPIEVKDFLVKVVKTFHVRHCTFDTWNYPETQQALQAEGCIVHDHIVTRDDHESVRRRFYEKKIHICNFPFVLDECKQLRIINVKRIDHIKGGSKDVIDSVANLDWTIANHGSFRIPLNIYKGI